jgi:hypothetical protein
LQIPTDQPLATASRLNLTKILNEQEVLIMMMKKLAIVGIASLTLSGMATSAFAASADVTAGPKAQDVAYTADGNFVVNDFRFAVSANVGLASVEDTVAIAVGTASNKGRNAFTGSSNGGSVTTCGDATTGSTIPTVPTPSLTANGGCSANAGS